MVSIGDVVLGWVASNDPGKLVVIEGCCRIASLY